MPEPRFNPEEALLAAQADLSDAHRELIRLHHECDALRAVVADHRLGPDDPRVRIAWLEGWRARQIEIDELIRSRAEP